MSDEELAQLKADAARYRWLCNNNYDRARPQVRTWLHWQEPDVQLGIPREWERRVRGGALDAVIDRLMPDEDKPERMAYRHADDFSVEAFALAMRAKMAASRAKGRGGWDDPERCPTDRLQAMLLEHLAKGDPVDVANFCMMLWVRGAATRGL